MKLELTSKANIDLSTIAQHTRETWGEDQASVYYNILDKAIKNIQRHPLIGRARPELGNNFFVLNVSQHVIIYQCTRDVLYIHRIVHNRMNIGDYLIQ